MLNATLIINQPGMPPREMNISEGIISIGRALDNIVCLDGDSNISRYHAVIEARIDGYWLSDLGSSNGTVLNGSPVLYERKLQHGDLIDLGGSSSIEVRMQINQTQSIEAIPYTNAISQPDVNLPTAAGSAPIDIPDTTASTTSVPTTQTSSKSSLILIAAGVGVTLILATVVVWFIISSGNCKGTVRIITPQAGATIRGPVPIRVQAENADCIEKVSYQIDSISFATLEAPPYATTLNPAEVSGLENGNHILSAVVVGADGSKEVQSDIVVAIEFSTGPIAASSPPTTELSSTPSVPVNQPSTGIDVSAMSQQLATQITRKSGYIFDPEFSEMIRGRIGEYRIGGYTDKARRHRLSVSRAYRDRGLDPLLGYVLAMSRSKFNENAIGDGIGLWQIPFGVAQAQGYLTATESEQTLKDPARSAEVSALYMKALIDVFEMDDFMYAIACFGMPISQAGQLRTQLISTVPDPVARRDFGKVIKSGIVKRDQVDRVVRFFAAGIVVENPQAFGLQTEQRFSDL
jgi:pSer/pThr/pTyr-binding forkhead associated (FHA) protein